MRAPFRSCSTMANSGFTRIFQALSMSEFEQINQGFNSVFKAGHLSIGVVIPIENYAQSTVPSLTEHLERAQLAESLGFKALWVRDVPLHLPVFGDAGQTYDPFAYLGFLAGQTKSICLGVASIALPLHHPVHVAKAAATLDQLTSGRFILGVASGDRPEEFPALKFDFEKRGEHFREAFEFLRLARASFPKLENNRYAELKGNIDVLPKPFGAKLPLMITGSSRQSIEWIAENGDGWMYYPRNFYMQSHNIKDFREHLKKKQLTNKPFMQPLYVDLHLADDYKPEHIHLGFRLGANHLVDYLKQLKEMGVNHVGINLRFNRGDIKETLERLAQKVLPHFHATENELQ